MPKIITLLFLCLAFIGCEDTDLHLASQAGIEAVQALTLSESQVKDLSARTAQHMDAQHELASQNNEYAQRLHQLVSSQREMHGYTFDFKVYLAPTVNAYALGDGTIRVYSGLMDMMNDQELLFVLGHEMGHVVHKHVQEKMRIALAASAVRKGVASQQNLVGDLAHSAIGGFIQRLLNAQFSQQEEREADDFGLQFMITNESDPFMAVSALEKLATLGSDHSFLSTHPAPQERAKRLHTTLSNPKQAHDRQDKNLLQSILDLGKKVLFWTVHLVENIVQFVLHLLGKDSEGH
jgi:putative metalloprotease